jgi:peptidoglycan/LPS O-acetylase OafA/YrhL
MNNAHTPGLAYRADIDGLRAIAVLAVVGFHAFPYWVKGGFIGVDVFFVISGFLISTIIFRSLETDRFSVLEFYGRRIRRIFPALLLVLVASYAFGWFALFATEFKQLGKHIAAGAGFVSNFALRAENGYFDTIADTKPLLHLWSLGIEEQFYIVWPLLLWLAWKKGFNLLTITVVVALISFALNVRMVRADTLAAFYSPQTRFWELLAGSALAYGTVYLQDWFSVRARKLDAWLGAVVFAKPPAPDGRTLREVGALVGAFLIGLGLLLVTKERLFPGWWALLPTTGAVLIIAAGPQAWLNRVILASPVLVGVGLISFPLYLWHWPLLSFARIIEGAMPSREVRIAAVALAVLFSWLTYRLIERPVRLSTRRGTITVGLMLMMLAVGYVGYNSYARDGLGFRDAIQAGERVRSQFVGSMWKYVKNDACLKNYPLKGSEDYGWWFCMVSSQEKPTVLLLGTSHANDLYPGLANNPRFAHHTFLSIGTCDAAWVDKTKSVKAIPGFEYSPCVGFRHAEQQELIDGIVQRAGSVQFAILDGLSRTADEDYLQRLKTRIDFLERHRVKVIIVMPHIATDFDIKECFPRPFKDARRNCEMSRAEYGKRTGNIEPVVRYLSRTNPGVVFFSQDDLFCTAEKCALIRDGMPLIRDTYGHISEYGSTELSKLFEAWAATNVPQFLR